MVREQQNLDLCTFDAFCIFYLIASQTSSSTQKWSYGTLLSVSWSRLGTLWGGVFWLFESFGIDLGRSRASQISGRGCARLPRRPSWMLSRWFFDDVARKFAKIRPLGPIFDATMLSEDDFRWNYDDFEWNFSRPNLKICNTLQHFWRFLHLSLHRL